MTVPLPTTPTGPWLSAVYHPRTYKRYYGLMRQSDGLRPVYELSRSVFALAGRPPHLPFFALIHGLRACHYPYPADCPSSLDGLSPGHMSLHHLRWVRLFRFDPSLASERFVSRGSSILVMLRPARWLGRLTSPRRRVRADRPARLRQSLPQRESPPAGVCYHYSAQPPIAEAGFSPARVSKNEGCTRTPTDRLALQFLVQGSPAAAAEIGAR